MLADPVSGSVLSQDSGVCCHLRPGGFGVRPLAELGRSPQPNGRGLRASHAITLDHGTGVLDVFSAWIYLPQRGHAGIIK